MGAMARRAESESCRHQSAQRRIARLRYVCVVSLGFLAMENRRLRCFQRTFALLFQVRMTKTTSLLTPDYNRTSERSASARKATSKSLRSRCAITTCCTRTSRPSKPRTISCATTSSTCNPACSSPRVKSHRCLAISTSRTLPAYLRSTYTITSLHPRRQWHLRR